MPKKQLRKPLTARNIEQIKRLSEQIKKLGIKEKICPMAIVKLLRADCRCLCCELDNGEL